MTNNNTANLDKKNDIKKFQKCLVIREISSKFPSLTVNIAKRLINSELNDTKMCYPTR